MINETSSSNYVFVHQVDVKGIPQFFNCLNICCVFLGWCSCQESSSFSMCSTTYHFIVHIDFRICFLEKWKPPTSIRCRFRKCWLVIIDGKQIINCNIFRSSFYITFDGENSLMVKFLLVEYARYKSFDLAESSHHS